MSANNFVQRGNKRRRLNGPRAGASSPDVDAARSRTISRGLRNDKRGFNFIERVPAKGGKVKADIRARQLNIIPTRQRNNLDDGIKTIEIKPELAKALQSLNNSGSHYATSSLVEKGKTLVLQRDLPVEMREARRINLEQAENESRKALERKSNYDGIAGTPKYYAHTIRTYDTLVEIPVKFSADQTENEDFLKRFYTRILRPLEIGLFIKRQYKRARADSIFTMPYPNILFFVRVNGKMVPWIDPAQARKMKVFKDNPNYNLLWHPAFEAYHSYHKFVDALAPAIDFNATSHELTDDSYQALLKARFETNPDIRFAQRYANSSVFDQRKYDAQIEANQKNADINHDIRNEVKTRNELKGLKYIRDNVRDIGVRNAYRNSGLGGD